MLEQYEFEGEIFNVHPSQKEDFLKKYPNAQPKQSEPDFQTPTAPDAVVEEDTASNMDSSSESTSLESPEDTNKDKLLQEDPNRDKLIQLETELEATRSDPKTMNSDENFRKRKSLNKQIKELGGFKKIKEEKLEEVVVEPKEEVDVKRRAEFRKKAQEVLNGDTIFNLGIDGKDIFELANGQNQSKFEVALKDEIKKRYFEYGREEDSRVGRLPQKTFQNAGTTGGAIETTEDDLVTIDRIVRDEIEKLKNKKSFEAKQIGISKINEMKRSGEYTPALDYAAKEISVNLDDKQKKYFGFQMQINQLNKTISQSTDATEIKSSEEKRNALLESQKLVAPQFEENPYDIFNISNKEQNTPYIDESGNSVGSFEAQESPKGLLTQPKKEYTAILDSYKNLNLENLENETVFWGLEKQDLDIDLNKTVNLKVGKKFMQESSVPGDALKSLGYNIESFDWKDDNANVGIIKDVKYSDLIKFRNSTTMFGLGFWDNISVDSKDTDTGKIKLELEELYKDKVNLNLKQRALTSLFALNTDPASKKISAVDFVATATKNTFTSIAGIVDKSVTPEMAAFLPVTKREDLDNLQTFLERADIKLSSEQKENFKRGFGFELLGETIPNFAGDLGRFAALNKVVGATGLSASVATMMKTNPIRGFMAQSLLEGFKFAAVMEDTSMFSEGVYFGAGSQLAAKALPKLPGPLGKYQQLYEKFIGGGVGMAAGSEFAAFSHAVVDYAMGDKAFQTSMADLYGKNSDSVKRIMSSVAMGGLLGGIKTKKIDIMEMSKRRDLYFETFSDIANGKYKGLELEKKQVMLSHLKRGIDIVDKHFNEADLGKQKAAKNEAQKFIDNGEGSRAEIKEAKKIVNTYELNKQRAKNKIKKQEERLIRSGVFKDGFRVDIVDGNQRILGKGNKAEYDGLNNVITIDINKYKPGVFAQEVGHAMMKAAFKNRPEVAKMFKEKIEELTNEKLKGEKFEVEGKTNLTFEEVIKESYEKPKRAEEYVMNVVEFLSQPKYRELLLDKGMLNELKRTTVLFGNKSKLDFTNSKNFTDGQQLLEFLYSINKVAEGGSSAQIKNKFKAFQNIVIDNKKLYNKTTGKEITKEDISNSKQITNSKDLQKSINELLPKEINTKDKYDAFLRDPSTDAKGFREFFENKGYLLNEKAPGKDFSIIELSEFSKKYRNERKNLLEATLDNGMISNYAKSRAIGSEAQQVVDNIRTKRLFNYDPAKAIGPDGFVKAMFSGVKFETLQARKDIANKIKTEDVTESKEANRIADNIVKTNIESEKSNGTPSIIQSNLKVNNKRIFERKEIVEEIDGKKAKRIQRNEIASKFIKEADAVLQQVADLGFKPTDKGFRKALAKVITKNNPELVDAFKESLGNYENFINENYATLLINKKALPLEFFVQAEKFRANVNENIFVKKSTNPKYKNGRATKQDLIREAIRKGQASYTENEAQGVNVYDRLTPPKAVGVDFFKIPNVKKRLVESLYKASIVDAVINQSRSKKIYTTAEVKEISTKLQKESDLYFSKAITSVDKAKQIIKESIISKGYGEKGRYKNAEEQVKDYKALIDYAESIKDPLILNLLERANVTPTSYDFRRSKDFWVGNGVKNTELRKELYDAGIIVDIATIHDYATSKFNVKKLTEKQSEAITFGKSVQNINTTKKGTGVQQGKKLVAKNAENETLRKNAISEYSKSVIKLMKFNPRATFSLIYNQSARGGQNRQLSKVMAWENGIKVGIKGKRDVHLEHLLQNGEFNLILIDAAKSNSKSGVKQVLKWISENYKQYAVKTTTADLVDQTVSLKDGTKWKAKSELHPDIKTAIKKVLNGEKNIKIPDADLRLFNGVIKANPNIINLAKGTLAKKWNVEVAKRFHNVRNVFEKQGDLIFKQIKGEITAAQAKKEIDLFTNKIAPSNIKAALKISKGKIKDINEAIEKLKETDKVNVEKQKEVFASKDLNTEFNKFLETSTGIGAEKVFSESKATVRGKKVKKSFGDYFIPVGAEDFAGLMHKTLAKGKKGENQLEFYNKNLYKPFNLANENITRERAALMNDFRALKQNLTSVPKDLNKMTKGGDFTIEQALRVAVWNKQGMEIPGLSKTDKIELLKEVNSNPELSNFVTELLKTTKGDGYAKPENNWELGTIVTDLMSLLNGPKRAKHLEVWSNNVEQIFSKENRYKLEAAYGRDYVQTLGKTLERMKNGSNRKWGGNPTVEKWLDWVNGSVGAIMFLNTRSAALQTISSINYLNFSDNNPLAAAKAFANQPQFWKDFKEIYNSDYLKDRRGGNKINVNESELALAAEKGGIQGVISLMLNKGFVLTKGADSFAIASGGSAMYRNRINKYQKEGLSEKEAKEKAFLDFKAITEETQQSSRADRISEQQASNAGRLLLAFANTPMQYNRLIKRNAQDLLAGRGNKAEKMTRITYYSTIQNFIFNALQKALFAVGFGDDDEETVKKYSNIGNGMVDSLLRGSGLTGNAALAIKNVAMDVADRFDRPRPNFQDAAWKALTVSPPIYSKVSKLRSAGYSLGYTTKDNIFNPSLDNPALSAGAQITSATLNLPLDRVLRKAQNIEAAMSDEAEWWQRSALLMGWGKWELGMQNPREKTKKKKSNKGLKTKSLKL